MKYKSEPLPLYQGSKGSKIHIIVVGSEAEWDKALLKIQKYEETPTELFDFHDCAAFAHTTVSKKNGSHFWMMFKKTNIDINTVSHECYHTVSSICISRGMTIDPHNDEPQAYLMGWIMNLTYNFLYNVRK